MGLVMIMGVSFDLTPWLPRTCPATGRNVPVIGLFAQDIGVIEVGIWKQ